MDPSRKRRIRLVVALTAALLLAGALVYTSFAASSDAVGPSALLKQKGAPGRSYQLTGKVVNGSVRRGGNTMTFRVRDRNGSTSVPVSYTGTVPDPFRDGREVIVTVRRQGARYVGRRDTLVTKCPSKFSDKQSTPTPS
ncbi:MAG: cytochrome c maturation protein CcmE [Actinomycetota bacterium]|nr:cytochrome c maturation protein CcmE [Actinomycetota bacterium]